MQQELAQTEASLKSATAKGAARRVEQLTGELARLGSRLETLTKTVDQTTSVLQKLGIAPSQRIRHGVTAEYLDIKPGMTGPEIKVAKFEKMPVDAFLKSGGGNTAQAQQKGELRDEITRPFREHTKERMEQLDAKLRAALSPEESSELAQLTERSQAARVAGWQDSDKKEKERLRAGLEERRDELREAASQGALEDEDEDEAELQALDEELRREAPDTAAAADAPPLTQAEDQRMTELRGKLKAALTKEEAVQLVAQRKRSQLAPGIAAANTEAEARTEKAGASAAPYLVGILEKMGIANPELLADNEEFAGADDDTSSESEDESRSTS